MNRLGEEKNPLPPSGFEPHCPTWSKLLCQLHFPGPHIYSLNWTFIKNEHFKTIIWNSVFTYSMETKYDLALNQWFLHMSGKLILTRTFHLKFTVLRMCWICYIYSKCQIIKDLTAINTGFKKYETTVHSQTLKHYSYSVNCVQTHGTQTNVLQ